MSRPRSAPPRARARASEPRQTSELTQRILVGVPAAVFAIVMIRLGGWWWAATAFALGCVAVGELFDMYKRVAPVRLAGFLAILAFVLAAELGGPDQVLLVTVALFPVAFLLSLAAGPDRPTVTARLSLTVFGTLWIGLAVAHAVLLRELPNGFGVIIAILVGTFLGDTFAYIGGRAFGRRPLAPAISPNKSVEGLLIGAVVAVFAVWAAGLYQDWIGMGQSVVLGVVIAVVAPLGDLFESQVKRDAGTKDAGRLFGVHGGALDRLDAALFALVAAYWVWRAMMG
jgi:phosphatidate cytidylyltransferase